MVPVSVAELKEHIGFLRAVHVASGPGEKSLYADGARLRTAVRTYCAWLASEAARAGGPTVLVTRAPPLEVAWIWHVHRLATVEYKTTCALLGVFVAPARGIGFAYGPNDARAKDAEAQDSEDELGAAVGVVGVR